MNIALQDTDALLVVDLQNDFLPGGSIAVPDGDRIIPVINNYLSLFDEKGLPVFASRDWHPENHMSFTPQQGIWPPHCVAGTSGAAFPSELELPETAEIISKGTEQEKEAYSALDSTGLDETMRRKNIERVFVCGLATDYCVLATAKDLVKNGFSVILLQDAVQAVNVNPGDGDNAIQELKELGVRVATLSEVES